MFSNDVLRRAVGYGALAVVALAGCVEYKSAPKLSAPKPTNRSPATKAAKSEKPAAADDKPQLGFDYLLPDPELRLPFKERQPIVFVTRSQNAAEWDQLPSFWNESTETARDPSTGEQVTRKIVKIKVPLGLTQPPPVPPENPLTVEKWALGKRLYFDTALSSDRTVSCATCHDPTLGYTDQSPVSTGIGGQQGGMSAPTVINSGYNLLQFWDGRALSLEHQAQGPVENPIEMFDGRGNAWHRAVQRIRNKKVYEGVFEKVFGHLATRDAIAKAIACYERTVLSGNSVHDRAGLAMRRRVAEEGVADFTIKPADYETVLKEALEAKDFQPLRDLGLDPEKDEAKIPQIAKQLDNGRKLFFGKARCNSCHAGDNFTDNLFHNLGVGVGEDGRIPPGKEGRFAILMTGHKNPDQMGAWKTPTLRSLLRTFPYMHDGSEKTLEEVVEFYDEGGVANEFLDAKMRDLDAEAAYVRLGPDKFKAQYGDKYPNVRLFHGRPIIPLKLGLTDQEQKDLVLFLKALNGDPVPPIIADPKKFPEGSLVAGK